MEYNKTKRGLELGAVLTALISCAVYLVIIFIGIVKIIEELNYLKQYYFDIYTEIINAMTGGIIALFIVLILLIIEVVFACILLKKIKNSNKSLENMKGARVTFLVFSCLLAFFILIGCIETSEPVIGILGFLTFATIIILESFVLGMKDVKDDGQEKKEVAVTTTLNIEQKIAELKHLKELGVIDEEQYKNAVEKNIKEIM